MTRSHRRRILTGSDTQKRNSGCRSSFALFMVLRCDAFSISAAIYDTDNGNSHRIAVHRIEHDKIVDWHLVHPHAFPWLPVYRSIAGRHEIKGAYLLADAVHLIPRRVGYEQFLRDIGVDILQTVQSLRRIDNVVRITHMPNSLASSASTSSAV